MLAGPGRQIVQGRALGRFSQESEVIRATVEENRPDSPGEGGWKGERPTAGEPGSWKASLRFWENNEGSGLVGGGGWEGQSRLKILLPESWLPTL